jgi:hypothetical protein
MGITDSYIGKYEGNWWLPGQEENAIQGSLDIRDGEEMYFQALYQFDKSKALFSVDEHIELHGLVKSEVDNNDYHVLIFDLIKVEWTVEKLSRIRYFVHKALIGRSDLLISTSYIGLKLSSDTFSMWVKGTGINIEKEDNINTGFPAITYKQPEPVDLFSEKDIKGSISFRCNRSYGNRRILKIVERPFLSLILNKPENLDGILALLANIEKFFMILWEQYHTFNFIDLNNDLRGTYRLLGSRFKQKSKDVAHFDYNDFRKSGDKYYQNWIRIYKNFDLSINTFFFAFAYYKVDIHSRFLNYLFALEQFHRRGFRDAEPLSKTDKKMYEKAMQIEQGDLKSWLEKVLNKERDIRIISRLQELCDFAELRERNQFSQDELIRIKNTRHYLVHLDEKHKKNVFSPREIDQINQKLESLFFGILKKNIIEEKPWPLLD